MLTLTYHSKRRRYVPRVTRLVNLKVTLRRREAECDAFARYRRSKMLTPCNCGHKRTRDPEAAGTQAPSAWITSSASASDMPGKSGSEMSFCHSDSVTL